MEAVDKGRRRSSGASRLQRRRRAGASAQALQAELLAQISEAVIVTDEKFVIRSWNVAAERVYGWTAGEVIGRRVPEVLVTRYAEGQSGDIEERFWRDGQYSGCVTQLRRDGATIEIAASVLKLEDASGRPAGAMAINRLATAENSAEDSKGAHTSATPAQRMGAMGTLALDSVATLAAGAAHEINNPLSFLVANVQFAVEELHSLSAALPLELDARLTPVLDALKEASEGAHRVRRIVQDLKAFARADEGERALVDLREVIDSSIAMATNEVRHRARLVRRFEVAPSVSAHPLRLRQVFLSLLLNAAESIAPGQADQNEIQVRVFTDQQGSVAAEVSDTGCGMTDQVLSRVFEPFFSTKPIGAGTGLGLSACHGIVRALGGEISAQSTLGRGSTFRVTLPPGQGEPPQPSGTVRPQTATSGRRARILAIDDEAPIGRMLKRILEPEHEVTVFADAREALSRLQAGVRFDLILCDLMMPNMTGMAFYEEVVSHFPELKDQIIFLTGGASLPEARAFLDRIEARRFEKPIDMEVLRTEVRRLLSGDPTPSRSG